MSNLEQQVQNQLTAWELADSPEGAAALDIAHRLGEDDLRPAAAAMLHAQLRGLVTDLRKLAPEAETSDEIDEVTAQREARRRAAGMA